MPWVWVGWLLGLIGSFAVLEGWALKTGRMTLSRFTWNLSKAWPPLPWAAGLLAGFLAAHFFWPGQGCLITGF
jgi:hypothetical protein